MDGAQYENIMNLLRRSADKLEAIAASLETIAANTKAPPEIIWNMPETPSPELLEAFQAAKLRGEG